MKLIVGLGNPGLRYRNTRHNIGFMALDKFAKAHKAKIDKKEFHSLFVRFSLDGEDIVLLKPQAFMNNSGEAVCACARKFGIKSNDILVVCDDINLKLGIIRLRANGSAGGHKGLRSLMENLHGQDFNRLRIGIDLERNGVLKDYVLSSFKRSEKKLVDEVINKAADAINVWINEGIEAAMNKFNERNRR